MTVLERPFVTLGRSTLPGRLVHLARTRPDRPALRRKRRGVWEPTTWREYRDEVAAVAMGLLELGVGPGDHVAILSENRPEWVYADLAAQAIGARSVGVYSTNPPPEVAYILSHSASVAVVCEDQEQVDKVVECAPDTPSVRTVIVVDPHGTRHYDDPRLMTWDEVVRRGRARAEVEPEGLERRIAALDPDEPCMVVYTSGTTGPPKGALLTSRNVTVSADAAVEVFGYTEREVVLSYLPLCHVAEKIFTLYLPLATGACVHFGESIDTVADDVREVSPTVFLGVPRIWEKMQSAVQVRIGNASRLKRWLFNFWFARGRRIARKRLEHRLHVGDRIVWKIGDLMVYRPLQERLGLRRCWYPVCGAAPIARELLEWFHAVGVPISEGYGQTECGGVSHVNRPGAARLGTVGTQLPGMECRISEEGEILLRGEAVFAGYLHDPEATRATIDEHGWLHTGDIGTLDEDGYLRITGRKKDIIITAGGKNLSPEYIENALKTSPYIKEAVAIGDGRVYVTALVQIDGDNVGEWASRRGIEYTSFADLTGNPEVRDLVDAEVTTANEQLARVEQVKAFRLLDKELHQDDDELTATQKVRRAVMLDRYADLVEQMYR